jgi:hypothetical protein
MRTALLSVAQTTGVHALVSGLVGDPSEDPADVAKRVCAALSDERVKGEVQTALRKRGEEYAALFEAAMTALAVGSPRAGYWSLKVSLWIALTGRAWRQLQV